MRHIKSDKPLNTKPDISDYEAKLMEKELVARWNEIEEFTKTAEAAGLLLAKHRKQLWDQQIRIEQALWELNKRVRIYGKERLFS